MAYWLTGITGITVALIGYCFWLDHYATDRDTNQPDQHDQRIDPTGRRYPNYGKWERHS